MLGDWGLGQLLYTVSLLLLYPTLLLLGLSVLLVLWHLGESVCDARLLRRHRRPENVRQLRDLGADGKRTIIAALRAVCDNRQ